MISQSVSLTRLTRFIHPPPTPHTHDPNHSTPSILNNKYNINKQEQTAADGGWDGVYEVNGQQVSLGQIQNILQQNKPTYGGDIVCANEDGSCCPAYCCNVKNTLHDLQQKPMDQSFRTNETSSLNGTFQVLSKQELFTHGTFAAVLYKDFPDPIFGGWTLELNFNKAVFDLHSFNAKVVGMADGAKTYFLRPVFWNKNVPAGPRRLIVQGLTTPEKDDGLTLEATGALWYDPTEQAVNLNPPAYVPEARPAVAPAAVPGEKYNLAEVLQVRKEGERDRREGGRKRGRKVFYKYLLHYTFSPSLPFSLPPANSSPSCSTKRSDRASYRRTSASFGGVTAD